MVSGMNRSASEIWVDLEGFEPPKCPVCRDTAQLDQDGYWCPKCSSPTELNPAVDDIPNGSEFDDIMAEYRKVIASE